MSLIALFPKRVASEGPERTRLLIRRRAARDKNVIRLIVRAWAVAAPGKLDVRDGVCGDAPRPGSPGLAGHTLESEDPLIKGGASFWAGQGDILPGP